MKRTRIIVTHYGGPEALQVVEEECPEPRGGEVRVKVLAAGVALPDIMARQGIHPETPPVPYTPGWNLSRREASRASSSSCPTRKVQKNEPLRRFCVPTTTFSTSIVGVNAP